MADLRDDGSQGAERPVAALAAMAAALVPRGSLTATLDGLAGEVIRAAPVAGVQILTPRSDGGGLATMGSAGFRRWPDFFERLAECQRRGAELRSYEAYRRGEPVVVIDRWAAIRDDPAWAPMRDYLGELPWESFVSIPLLPGAGEQPPAAGVLNVFLAPGEPASGQTLTLLAALAEQAAIAVGYAAAIGAAREAARQEERQRLARELHDRVVQQVFSISMQAAALQLLSGRPGDGPAGALTAALVDRAAADIGDLAGGALTDLRAMLSELTPPSPALAGGLAAAVRALADGSGGPHGRRAGRPPSGLRYRLSVGAGVDAVPAELAEDAYRVIAEAVHNVVKHAGAGTVAIRLTLRDGRLRASVTDDGRGAGASGPGTGHGLRAMRERAERWGGRVTVGAARGGGTAVRLVVPLPGPGTP